jgi:hypothetical protein
MAEVTQKPKSFFSLPCITIVVNAITFNSI